MPNLRYTRFGTAAPRVPQPEVREEIFEPTLGFDGGQAPQELDKGYTPQSQNWVKDGGYLTPRSGLSRYDATYSLGDAGLFGMEAFGVDGFRHGIIASAATVGFMGANSGSWSNLSYTGSDNAYANNVEGWDGAFIYDSTRDKNIAVLTENSHQPKYLVLDSATTNYSDFTYSASAFSKARSVCAFDNRLVWFNTSSSVSNFPQRVEWSTRGVPTDYTLANGAGSQDLMDMRGTGVRVIAEQDGVLLFTDVEIWRGRRRGDDYVFDFFPVTKSMGCPYPKTIAQTPEGVIFVGRDLEVYLLNGNQLVAIGPTQRKPPEQGDASRIQKYLQDNLTNGTLAFSVYNTQRRRYELSFSITGVFPMRGLYYDFSNGSWFMQQFDNAELSCGFEMEDVGEAATWDSISFTWDQYNVPWNSGDLSVPSRRVVMVSSNGTPYRFISTQTTDDGTAIEARWRSHGMNQRDQFRYDELHEVQLEYASNSNSSASVYVSDNLGSSFIGTPMAVNLSATSHSATLVPVWVSALAPVFELRLNDGGQPKFSRFQARLRDGGLFGGAL